MHADRPGVCTIGVIGDVHAQDDTLAHLLDLLAAQADMVCCVGDLVTGPGSPDHCIELLRAYDVATVLGNHDEWLLQGTAFGFEDGHRLSDLTEDAVAFIRALPRQIEFRLHDHARLLLCHGLGPNTMNNLRSDDYGYAVEVNEDLQHLLADPEPRIVAKGHRHNPSVWQMKHLTLIDAGVLSRPAEGCAALIDLSAGHVRLIGLANGTARTVGDPFPITPAPGRESSVRGRW